MDMDSFSSHSQGQSPPHPSNTDNPWARPEDYDSKLESWFEDAEAAPTKTNKGKKIVTDDPPNSPISSHHNPDQGDSSHSEGAPGEELFDLNITSPESSPERYEHPKIESWEEDVERVNFPDKNSLSPRTVENIKKKADKMSCVDQDSLISWDELEWVRDYYHMESKSVLLKEGMRPHRFDKDNIRIPRMVTTLRHVPLGVSAPLPTFYHDVCKSFQVTPIQLSPNSYMLLAGLCILYQKAGLSEPTMREVRYFFRLAQSALGIST